MTTCTHPPTRLYSWWALNERMQPELIVGCQECGELLKGGITGEGEK